MERIRKHVILHGDVQGVGLRYRAYYAARALGIAGSVRNLSDGTVELEAEGDRESIERLIEKIAAGRFVEITDYEVRIVPVTGERDFHVLD